MADSGFYNTAFQGLGMVVRVTGQHWEGMGHAYEMVTWGVRLVLVPFTILTVVVNMQTYIGDKIVQTFTYI